MDFHPFHLFRSLKNLILVLPYFIRERCMQNFKFLALVVWALADMSVSESVIFYFYTYRLLSQLAL